MKLKLIENFEIEAVNFEDYHAFSKKAEFFYWKWVIQPKREFQQPGFTNLDSHLGWQPEGMGMIASSLCWWNLIVVLVLGLVHEIPAWWASVNGSWWRGPLQIGKAIR